MRAVLGGNDIRFANLDCTFDCSGTPPHPDEYLIAASPGQLDLLCELGINLVSQANNHSMDFGGRSLQITKTQLVGRGIRCVGAGCDIFEARKPVLIDCNSLRVGFLAYASTHPWIGAIAATKEDPGVAPLDPVSMKQDVEALNVVADCVVVSVHWGKEYINYPAPEYLKLGKQLIDSGAMVVLGHHPHVVQGIEEYRGGVICYSLGNFIFPDYPEQGLRFETEFDFSIGVSLELSRDAVESYEVVPFRFVGNKSPVVLRSLDGVKCLDHLSQYSATLQNPRYSRIWRRELRRHEMRRIRRVLQREVFEPGWRLGTMRLMGLGLKNLRSIGRSMAEIFGVR